MKYFFDTEFIEGSQTKRLFGMPIGKIKPTIDFISIGIVSDDREYYAISKDFNLREAWDRYDVKIKGSFDAGQFEEKVYWIRENVLKPIYNELWKKNIFIKPGILNIDGYIDSPFTYKGLKKLIKKYGKSNAEIAEEIKDFCRPNSREAYNSGVDYVIQPIDYPEFYAYYADYDWVAFCWLFGRMIDLPKGFPKYCIDLKQMMDEKFESMTIADRLYPNEGKDGCFEIKSLKEIDGYPEQKNEHNALADAKWNMELFNFLKEL
jgi:hypothetical protein